MGELKASCCWEIYYMLQILIIYVLYIEEIRKEKYLFQKEIQRQLDMVCKNDVNFCSLLAGYLSNIA